MDTYQLIFLYLILFIVIGVLSYEQGQYKGANKVCDGIVVQGLNGLECQKYYNNTLLCYGEK